MTSVTFPGAPAAPEALGRITAPLLPSSLSLRPGSILILTVQSLLGPNEFLMKAGNQSFAAKFPGTLTPGQKITVQVVELGNPVVLKLLSPANPLRESVANWRLNPLSLLQAFSRAGEITTSLKKEEIAAALMALKQAQGGNLLEGLILSPKTAGAHYLIHLVRNLGLAWERDLSRSSSRGRIPPLGEYPLKPTLILVEEELARLLARADLVGDERQQALELDRFVKSFLASIEALQGVNVQSWEEDGKFILQFPIEQGGKLTLGEILIEREPGSKDAPGEEKWHFYLYVNFDQIGEMAVEIKSHGRKLDVAILADLAGTVDLVSQSLTALREALLLLGYQVDVLECRRMENPASLRDRHFNALSINRTDLLNVFA